MRGLLERGLAFEFGQECVEGFDFGGREGDPGVLPGPAIARLSGQIGGALERDRAKAGHKAGGAGGRPGRARSATLAAPANCNGARESLPPPSPIERSAMARVRM